MKKILTFLFVLIASTSLPAQKVGYLLTEAEVDDLPTENAGGEDQKPEQNAANWFSATYGSNDTLVTFSDLASLDPNEVSVLWINIDRSSFSKEDFDAIFTNEVVAPIKSYVEAGGNLLLTKQAARLAYRIGRIGYENNWSYTGYNDGTDTWYLKTKLGGGTANPTDRSGHAIYKNIAKNDNGEFALVGPVKRSDRNTPWQDYLRKDGAGDTHYDNANVQRLIDFESDWKCQALATWPHINDYCYPMVIDFLPGYETFTGGMLAICLAAYQWGTGNYDAEKGHIANVQKLTQNSIEYLYGSDPRPQVEASWNVTPADGIIGGSMTASVTTTGTIAWSSLDNTVASVSSEGVIAYNGFGSCTIKAVVSKDGYADKNLEQTITVTGGTAATYAYALPYSLYTMQHYDNEEDFYPDYQAAKWFYDNYVAHGTGCFINPTDYSSSSAISSAVKVLWVNNDHVGLSKEIYYANLGGDNFKDALQTFVDGGGNLYLSKQACYLAFKLGKIYDPDSWGDGGYTTNSEIWGINAKYIGKDVVESGIDRSNHPIYHELTNVPNFTHNGSSEGYDYEVFPLVNSTDRTNNNTIWSDMWKNMEKSDKEDNCSTTKLSNFEEQWNCKVLGVWEHVKDFCAAGLIEFNPEDSNGGIIIANGFSAYQWGTNNLNDTAISNVKKLTQNALEYLYSVGTYTRSGLTEGQYGTICLPRASAATLGATFFRVFGKTSRGVVVEEVDELEAGKPYIFEASADEISVTCTGNAVIEPNNSESNGLIGSFVLADIANNENYYILKNNELFQVKNSKVGANRAYFDLGTMRDYDLSQSISGRRRLLGIDRPDMPTEVENAEAAKIESRKVIENGQLFIIKNGVKYNAQGQIVR